MTQTTILLIFLITSLPIPSASSSYTTPSKALEFTVGSNLITNPNLTTPIIAPMCYFDQMYYLEGWTTKVLIVEYIDTYLLMLTGGVGLCTEYKGTIKGQQFLDVDSYNMNEQYYQRFTLTAGRFFRLSFDWISQLKTRVTSVGISVLWNGATIDTFYDISCILQNSTYYFTSIDGSNQIVFQGMGTPDSGGILIRNIVLQEMFYIDKLYTFWNVSLVLNDSLFWTVYSAFYNVHDNQLGYYISSFSAVKQNARFLCGYWLQFNHLVLYNYHLFNNTLMSTIILAGAQAMDDERGRILDNYIFPMLGMSPQKMIAWLQLNNSLSVNMNRAVQIYITRPSSALLQILNILLIDVPVTVVFFLIGAVLFHVCFKYRISVLFQQYSVLIFLIYVVLDGRIQILTFHVLSRILLLANIGFIQKIVAIFVIWMYFLVFFSALALMVLYRSSIYMRLIKYVSQNCRYASTGTLHMTLQFGIYNIVLGFAHRLLLTYPFLQLCVLITIQIIFIGYLLFFFIRCRYCNIILGGIICCLNCCRLLFAISLLIFRIIPALQEMISMIQLYLFYVFVLLISISMMVCLLQKGFLVYNIFRKGSLNRVDNYKNQDEHQEKRKIERGNGVRMKVHLEQVGSRKELMKDRIESKQPKRSVIYQEYPKNPSQRIKHSKPPFSRC